jgi:glycosyltransferase involved in cell wall biosynthesis
LTLAAIVLWTALGVVAYVYVGYPIVLFLLAKVAAKPVKKAPITPSATMIIAAYNEEDAIAAKLDNTLALDYPPGLLEILVASDGSTDRTNAIVERDYAGRATLLALPRGGKTAGQNYAASVARGEILVFSDATTMYDRGALRALVANFADPTVGSVGGDVRYTIEGAAVAGRGRQLYWNYEAAIRRWESRLFTVIGATGCIYSLRRALYVPLDPAAISDFVQPAMALLRGYRSVVEDDAGAYEVAESKAMGDELQRRARVVLRGLRGVGYMPAVLNPFRHPWLFAQIVSHRLLRWGVPLFLLAALVANAFLLRSPGYAVLFALQVAFYGAAVLALLLDRIKVRLPGLFVPLYFCLVNVAPLVAFWLLLKGEKKVFWETGAQPAK